MKKWLKNTFYEPLPQEWKDTILLSTHYTKTITYTKDPTKFTITDTETEDETFFLPSIYELCDKYNKNFDFAHDNDHILWEFFKNKQGYIFRTKDGNNKSIILRTPVIPGGGATDIIASNARQVRLLESISNSFGTKNISIDTTNSISQLYITPCCVISPTTNLQP